MKPKCYRLSKPKKGLTMDFASAIEGCRNADLPICRKGWNGKGMFVYSVPAGNYPATSRVAKKAFGENALIPYGSYLAIKGADGIVSPWVPSQVDMAANDWEYAEI